MKAGMRHLASGVAVAAARGSDGIRHGMTVTSVTSVSDQPPSLLVCLHRESITFRSLDTTDFFSVSILKQAQEEISHRCAFTPDDEDRFSLGEWRDYGEQRIPYLHGALAVFLCRITRRIDYGTHCIIIGDIIDVIANGDNDQPLIYCRGEYKSLA